MLVVDTRNSYSYLILVIHTPTQDDIVDLQNHHHRLRRQLDGRQRDQHRLNDLVLHHVRDGALLRVDAVHRAVRLQVPVAQLRDDHQRVEPRVLRQRVGNHLERLRKGLDAHLLHAEKRARPRAEPLRQRHLGGAATGHDGATLHQAAHHAERVVQRPLGLVEHEVVGRAHQHGRRLLHVHARDLHNLLPPLELRLHQLRRAQLLLREVVQAGDLLAANGARDELDVLALNVLDDHDVGLGQVVEREVGDGVPENRLLDQEDVAARRGDLLHHARRDEPLLAHDAVNRLVVLHHHRVLHVGLGRREAELDQADLGVGYTRRPARHAHDLLLRQHEPVHHLRVLDRAPDALDHADVLQVHVDRVLSLHHGEHAVDCDWRQQRRVRRHHLRVQRDGGDIGQRVLVVEADGLRYRLQNLLALVRRQLEAVCHSLGVDALVEQVVGPLQ
ncbi:plexin-A4 isoform X1, putative [Babesia caballi]|uniref:Plexin-A4 isoform X1, putative n=1 Tax=Babesia caballi TaxID=5871 RepID=A0AAV4M2T0_BABCB|nr:plexin-A4 isoform X1, putative [Babesia caballi]